MGIFKNHITTEHEAQALQEAGRHFMSFKDNEEKPIYTVKVNIRAHLAACGFTASEIEYALNVIFHGKG
jgi:hypothetical protein